MCKPEKFFSGNQRNWLGTYPTSPLIESGQSSMVCQLCMTN